MTAARFRIGDLVRVRSVHPPGHVRTPAFVRGRRGIVQGLAGVFANPEELAYGRSGAPARPLYRVRFDQSELWGDGAEAASDTVVIDLFEHWLEPAKEERHGHAP